MINENICSLCLSFIIPKDVTIDPVEFELQSGGSGQIRLQFKEPAAVANSTLLPIYSGFIYATNTITGQSVHMTCKMSLVNCTFYYCPSINSLIFQMPV